MGLKKLLHRKKKTLTTSIEHELEQVFKKLDINGDGKISSSELGSIMHRLGHRPTDEELESMVKQVADTDGFIDLNTKDIDSSEALESLRDAFSVFDIDNNGLISAEELQKVLGRLEEECTVAECRRMIAGVDANGDRMISFDEFKVMMISGTRFDGIQSQSQSQRHVNRNNTYYFDMVDH